MNICQRTTEWYSSLSIKAKYFILAIVLIGSIGVWLPILIEGFNGIGTVNLSGLTQNIITYFISILVSGSISYFFLKLDKAKKQGIASIFLDLVALIIFSIGLVIVGVWCNVNGYLGTSLCIGLVGVALSYRIWWLANKNDMNVAAYEDPLGGAVDKPLMNGK